MFFASNQYSVNIYAASILRPYFPDPPSDDIHIARQSDRKNPIRNLARQKLNFHPYRV
jgi:hypothetical protein